MFPSLCCVAVSLPIAWMKPLPTPSSLDWGNIVMAAMWTWRYCTLEAGWYLHNASFLWVCRAIQGIVMGNSRLAFALHAVVTTADVMVHSALNLNHSPKRDRTCSSQMFFLTNGEKTQAFGLFALKGGATLLRSFLLFASSWP